MSDQIKTQHGTIGLLMAECEQLRRDLGNARHDLGLWAAEFDKQWPKDVKMTIANLRADMAKAKAENVDLRQKLSGHEIAGAMLAEQLEKARAEIERLRQQISSEKVKP